MTGMYKTASSKISVEVTYTGNYLIKEKRRFNKCLKWRLCCEAEKPGNDKRQNHFLEQATQGGSRPIAMEIESSYIVAESWVVSQ